MGLRGTFFYSGLKITNAYARIDITQSADSTCIMSVNIYANLDARRQGEGYLQQKYPLSFTKLLGEHVGDDKTQGYHFLKTTAEWQEWEDVFEEGQPS
ncbi:hypothetical protein [Priestia flexa]|uniref:hypothetical protein n=1 Tax=Priestia flexa TaxID=86664 RepID=UPI0013D7CF48|nr:hypothetical protein [Priestia flexa]